MKTAYWIAAVLAFVLPAAACESDIVSVEQTADAILTLERLGTAETAAIGLLHARVEEAAASQRKDPTIRQDKPLGVWAVVGAFTCANCQAKSVPEIEGGVSWPMPDGAKMVAVETGSSNAYRIRLIGQYHGNETSVSFEIEGGGSSTFDGMTIYPGPPAKY